MIRKRVEKTVEVLLVAAAAVEAEAEASMPCPIR
jgi:hypothetical protein